MELVAFTKTPKQRWLRPFKAAVDAQLKNYLNTFKSRVLNVVARYDIRKNVEVITNSRHKLEFSLRPTYPRTRPRPPYSDILWTRITTRADGFILQFGFWFSEWLDSNNWLHTSPRVMNTAQSVTLYRWIHEKRGGWVVSVGLSDSGSVGRWFESRRSHFIYA